MEIPIKNHKGEIIAVFVGRVSNNNRRRIHQHQFYKEVHIF